MPELTATFTDWDETLAVHEQPAVQDPYLEDLAHMKTNVNPAILPLTTIGSKNYIWTERCILSTCVNLSAFTRKYQDFTEKYQEKFSKEKFKKHLLAIANIHSHPGMENHVVITPYDVLYAQKNNLPLPAEPGSYYRYKVQPHIKALVKEQVQKAIQQGLISGTFDQEKLEQAQKSFVSDLDYEEQTLIPRKKADLSKAIAIANVLAFEKDRGNEISRILITDDKSSVLEDVKKDPKLTILCDTSLQIATLLCTPQLNATDSLLFAYQQAGFGNPATITALRDHKQQLQDQISALEEQMALLNQVLSVTSAKKRTSLFRSKKEDAIDETIVIKKQKIQTMSDEIKVIQTQLKAVEELLAKIHAQNRWVGATPSLKKIGTREQALHSSTPQAEQKISDEQTAPNPTSPNSLTDGKS